MLRSSLEETILRSSLVVWENVEIVSPRDDFGVYHNPIFILGIFSGVSTQNKAAQTEPGRPDRGPPHQKNLKTGSEAHFSEFGEV
jgi:hypothetical protein